MKPEEVYRNPRGDRYRIIDNPVGSVYRIEWLNCPHKYRFWLWDGMCGGPWTREEPTR